MERQKHGFTFEKLCSKKFGIELNSDYTSKWDGMKNGFPVSIKLIKNNSDICMSDYFRQSEITEDFYFIVGFWEEEKSNIKKIETLFINGKEYHSLFSEELSPQIRKIIENISNKRSDDSKWKAEVKNINKIWESKTDNIIRLRFKRDHKKQKRVQCAINYNNFYNYFVKKYKMDVI